MPAWTRLAAVAFCSTAPCSPAVLAPQERVRLAPRAEVEQRALDKISAVVRGQCIDGATGEPKAGCVVTLEAFGGRRDADADASLLEPTSVTTGPDGAFAVRVYAREDFQVGLEITFEGCWPRTGRWHYLVPGEAEDLGRIELHRGVYAVGRVVDTAGEPVPRISVGIDELPLYVGVEKDRGDTRSLEERLAANAASGTRAFHLHANKVRYASTGADGAFQSRDALPPGTYELCISRHDVTLVEPKTIAIPAEGPMAPITVVVEQQPFLAGRVINDAGEPVSGVYLQQSDGKPSDSTRDDGTFKIYRREGCPDRVSLRILEPGPCERPPPTPEYAWGTHDIEIVLQRMLSVDLLVVEAGSGEPIEDFAIRGYRTSGSEFHSADRHLRLSGRHEGGKLTVDRVLRGRNRITVVPKDPVLLPASIDVDGVAGQPRVSVELQRLVQKMVRVLDAEGLPARNVEVQVIAPGNFEPAGDSDVVVDPRAEGLRAYSSDPNVTFDTLLYSARTDGGGTCIVYGIDGREDLVLGVRIEGRRRLHRVADVAFGRQHGSQEIRLDP